jgi:hypothetical protein
VLGVLVIASLAIAQPKWTFADSPTAQRELNPVFVAQAIARDGEKAAIRSLRKDKARWKSFISSVSSGEQAWIDVGLLLLPHTTGVARIDLRKAFEDALAVSPLTTLPPVSSRSPNLALICGSSAHGSYDLAENSINQRLSAVGSVLVEGNAKLADASLRARFHKCADMLQAADEQLRGEQGKTTPRK